MGVAPTLSNPRTTPSYDSAGFAVSLVTEAEALHRLGPEWSHVEQLTLDVTPFSSFEWAYHWSQEFMRASRARQATRRARILRRNRSLFVVLGREDSGTTWIAPFVRVQYQLLGIRLHCLEFLTAPDASYSDVLGAGKEYQIRSLVSFLCEHASEWDCMDLRHIPSSSRTPERLLDAARHAGLEGRIREDEPWLVMKVESDWQGTLRRKSKATRGLFRNQANRLQRAGAVVRLLADPSVEPGLAARLAHIEAQKYVKAVPTLRVMPGHEEFYDTIFKQLGPKQRMYAALLEMEGRLVAYEWGFRTRDRIMVFNKAYLPEFARFSPGTMLVPPVIDFAYQHGCREYDFLHGQLAYKWRWASELRSARRIEIWSPAIRSRIAKTALLQVKPVTLRALSALGIRYTPPWEI